MVDNIVFTKKILLYAGNSCISSPLLFIGTIYLFHNYMSRQSAGNFSFSSKATGRIDNTYNKYINLPLISKNVSKHNSNLTDSNFGYFLAGLIEGDGWFGKKQLHIIFSEKDIALAYFIKKRIGYGHVYKIKNKKAVRYICKDKKGLLLILSLINGKFVSTHKFDQLVKHNYAQDFNIKILPPAEQLRKLLVRDQLPNSGNALKFLIPNYINSGWTNYSWVISQKMIEKEMGNRGSKLKDDCKTTPFVKEQRVDGSWQFLSGGGG